MTDAVTHAELAHRIDQSIADFKAFVAQRFADQDTLRRSERNADNRLLDERFKTQTTTLDAAFAAAEKARQEALSTARDDASRVDARIKALENDGSKYSGRSLGRADSVAWLTTAAVVAGTVLYHFH